MTELQYDFLVRYEALDYPAPQWLEANDLSLFESCRACKYIRRVILSNGDWGFRISAAGRTAMLEFENAARKVSEQRAQQEEKEKSQQALEQDREKRSSVRSWLQCIASALVGALLQKWLGLF